MRPLIPLPTINPDLFMVEFDIGIDPHPTQQDAIFYTGAGRVATVKYEGFEVDVYCDGETKANLLDTPQGQVVSTLYFPADFIDAGLNTDAALRLANEQELLDWVNNSWFDLYCYGEHLDCVEHELIEAIDRAKTYVGDEWLNAEMFMR
jgi:hypothetical protein